MALSNRPFCGATSSAPGLETADINNDGIPDLLFTDGTASTANDVHVLLGVGDGTFQPEILSATSQSPSVFAVADFNHDGNQDVAVLNDLFDSYSILLGNGDGTFQPPTTHIVRPNCIDIVSSDLNNDGKADLVISGTTGNSPWIMSLLGQGNGTFIDKGKYPAGYSGLVTGDFNNDGRQDVAVLSGPTIDQFAFTGALLQGNGDGTFRPASYFTVPFYVGNLTSRRFQPRRQT